MLQYPNGVTLRSKNATTGTKLCNKQRKRPGQSTRNRKGKYKLEHSFVRPPKQDKTTNGLHSTSKTTNIIWSTKIISMLEMWKHIFCGPSPNMPRKANAMQNLQKSRALHFVVYGQNARKTTTTRTNEQHKSPS